MDLGVGARGRRDGKGEGMRQEGRSRKEGGWEGEEGEASQFAVRTNNSHKMSAPMARGSTVQRGAEGSSLSGWSAARVAI